MSLPRAVGPTSEPGPLTHQAPRCANAIAPGPEPVPPPLQRASCSQLQELTCPQHALLTGCVPGLWGPPACRAHCWLVKSQQVFPQAGSPHPNVGLLQLDFGSLAHAVALAPAVAAIPGRGSSAPTLSAHLGGAAGGITGTGRRGSSPGVGLAPHATCSRTLLGALRCGTG